LYGRCRCVLKSETCALICCELLCEVSINTMNHSSGIEDICPIIPVLNPDGKLVSVVESLVASGFQTILLVDDGSRKEHERYFDQISEYPQCVLIRHSRNLGKGRALKTAFNHYLNHFSHLKGIITVDADNQHHIDDIVRCTKLFLKNPDSLILGARDFKGKNIPLKNRMGNQITIFVMNFLCGIKISDTQTGLRAMSNDLASLFLDIPGERFEYETNMLIETKKKAIPIKEQIIRTLYIENNKSSHFNPLLDSIRIYALILKFLSSSIGSVAIDLTVFSILMIVLAARPLEIKVIASTITARITSSLFNYLMNRRFVFQSGYAISKTLLKYYLLAIIQMLVSMGSVYLLVRNIPIHATLWKVFVDGILFFASFQIQREWVFRNKKTPEFDTTDLEKTNL
jgi:glycosyltransferase involved in cell wall biosynthesis